MGTEVLRPHDCFVHRFPLDPFAYQRRRSYYFENRNVFVTQKPAKISRPERLEKKNKWKKEFQQQPLTIRKRSFSENELLQKNNNVHRNNAATNNYEQPPTPPVETGRVTILRRGQSFDSFENTNKIRNEIITSGSDADIYAGSAFSMSPPPNSLPLPSFFNNNNNNNNNKKKKFEYEDSASKDLRRLLGLK